jgi:hypothetical protein
VGTASYLFLETDSPVSAVEEEVDNDDLDCWSDNEPDPEEQSAEQRAILAF